MTDKGPRIRKVPPGDQHERLTCPECDHVVYENPKIVNITVATFEGKFLLCRRGIQPRVGFWTLPGGYMEKGETVQEGAARETFEEAGAKVNIGELIAIYHTPDKANVMMIFRAEMMSSEFSSGVESLETKLFEWKDIPWGELAFPMVERALKRYEATKHLPQVTPEIAVMPPMPQAPMPPVKKPQGPKI